MQLLQRDNQMHTLFQHFNFKYTYSYMFWVSLVHHQGVHCCIKQLSNPTIYTQTYRQLQLLCTYPFLYSYADKITTTLHNGNDKRVRQLLYTTVHSPMMGL